MDNNLKKRGLIPTFSVVIAVYNGEKTIAKAINSILKQTFTAKEIIIIDDGSSDNTKEQVDSFGDKVIYYYQENSGVSAARNKGVEVATGEWICFLDADDWYYENRLQRHADLLENEPSVDFLTSNFDYIDENGQIIRQSMPATDAGKTILSQVADDDDFIMQGELINRFVEQHFGDTHTLSVRKKTFLQLGGYPVGVAVCEDVHFLIRLCAISHKIGVVTIPLAAYFIHQSSATRSNPLRAQLQSVDSLVRLKKDIKTDSPWLFSGLLGAIRHARLDLAYTLIKMNKRIASIKAVMPLFFENPGIKSIRDVLSIVKG